MTRLFVRHQVDEYRTWRPVYDEFDGTRVAMGVRGAAVFQSIDDPNDVTVWHDFDSAEAARAFVASKDLRDSMARAGVVGAPTVWLVTEV